MITHIYRSATQTSPPNPLVNRGLNWNVTMTFSKPLLDPMIRIYNMDGPFSASLFRDMAGFEPIPFPPASSLGFRLILLPIIYTDLQPR